MPQNKRQIKPTTVLLLTTILIFQFFLISLAKTEVYFSFFCNSISPALQKTEDKIININSASQEELTSILQISKPLTQLPEITNLEWEEWEEEGIVIVLE